MPLLTIGPSTRVKLIAIAAFILLIGMAQLGIWRPALGSQDGTYINQCCPPVRLEKGKLLVDDKSVGYQLSWTKVGLEMIPAKRVDVHGGHDIEIVEDAEPMPILFDDHRDSFTLLGTPGLPGQMAEHVFKRQ